MEQYIPKSALVAEIESLKSAAETMLTGKTDLSYWKAQKHLCERILSFINALEAIDPYEQFIQYPSREDGIKAHAEDYSWNIESELLQQLTPEQQKLWRKEIEQACISGGYCGLNLQKDRRYDANLGVKEVDLNWENIRELCALSVVVELEKGRSLTDQEHYTEVIKRFKAKKGE